MLLLTSGLTSERPVWSQTPSDFHKDVTLNPNALTVLPDQVSVGGSVTFSVSAEQGRHVAIAASRSNTGTTLRGATLQLGSDAAIIAQGQSEGFGFFISTFEIPRDAPAGQYYFQAIVAEDPALTRAVTVSNLATLTVRAPQGPHVVFPPGFPVPSTRFSVISIDGEARLAADGSFPRDPLPQGPGIALVVGDDSALVMGAITDGQAQAPIIDARSTAELLLYLGTGAFTLGGALRDHILDGIRSSAHTTQLATFLERHLLANPAGLPPVDPELSGAVLAAATGFASQALSRADLGILPSITQSGVGIIEHVGDTIVIRNGLRRWIHAFVDKVGTKDEEGRETRLPRPIQFSDLALPPISFLRQGAIGTLRELVLRPGTVLSLMEQKESGLIPLPRDPNTAKTLYTVTVVGPGFRSSPVPEVEAELNRDPERLAKRQAAFQRTLVQEALIPAVLTFLIRFDKADQFFRIPRLGDAIKDILEVVKTVSGSDRILEPLPATHAGYVEKLRDLIGVLATSETARRAILRRLAVWIAQAGGDIQSVERGIRLIEIGTKAALLVEGAFRVTDLGAILESLAASATTDRFNIEVGETTVAIRPRPGVVGYGESEQFRAKVSQLATPPDTSGSVSALAYRWTTTGRFGRFEADQRGTLSQDGRTMATSLDTVTYRAGDRRGTDDITLDVTEVQTGGGVVRRSLGQATTEVQVVSLVRLVDAYLPRNDPLLLRAREALGFVPGSEGDGIERGPRFFAVRRLIVEDSGNLLVTTEQDSGLHRVSSGGEVAAVRRDPRICRLYLDSAQLVLPCTEYAERQEAVREYLRIGIFLGRPRVFDLYLSLDSPPSTLSHVIAELARTPEGRIFSLEGECLTCTVFENQVSPFQPPPEYLYKPQIVDLLSGSRTDIHPGLDALAFASVSSDEFLVLEGAGRYFLTLTRAGEVRYNAILSRALVRLVPEYEGFCGYANSLFGCLSPQPYGGLAVGRDGSVYASANYRTRDGQGPRVIRVAPDGRAEFFDKVFLDGTPRLLSQLVERDGTVYVLGQLYTYATLNTPQWVVFRIGRDGAASIVARLTPAQSNEGFVPESIGVDAVGNVYVGGNRGILKVVAE